MEQILTFQVSFIQFVSSSCEGPRGHILRKLVKKWKRILEFSWKPLKRLAYNIAKKEKKKVQPTNIPNFSKIQNAAKNKTSKQTNVSKINKYTIVCIYQLKKIQNRDPYPYPCTNSSPSSNFQIKDLFTNDPPFYIVSFSRR